MLTVGTYKTRDGRDVKILAIDDGIAIGYIVAEGIDGVTTWDANNGHYWINDATEDCNDIIDTKPRIKFERWATIGYEKSIGYFIIGLHATLGKAKAGSLDCIAIARVEIDCVEGENLD